MTIATNRDSFADRTEIFFKLNKKIICYFFKFFFILFSTNCFSQIDTTVLIVPMKSGFVEFDHSVVKMLNYNNVQIDSVKKNVQNLSIGRLKVQFPHFSFINLQDNIDFRYLIDSLNVLCQWNSFQIKKISDSKGVDKIFLVNDERPQFKYYGRIIKEKDIVIFRALIQKYSFKYIFFINKFETITRRPFSSKTFFCLHFEIYDQTLDKIFGGKSYWSAQISRTMYSNVFSYFTRKAFDDFYELIKKKLTLQ